MADSPYPELKKTHTMAHTGRRGATTSRRRRRRCGRSSRASASTGCWWPRSSSACSTPWRDAGRRRPSPGRASSTCPAAPRPPARRARDVRVPRPGRRRVRAERDRRALPVHGRRGVDGRRWSRVAPGPHGNWTRLADTIRHGRRRPTPIEDDAGGVLRAARHGHVPDPAARRVPARRDARLGPPPGAAGARPRGRAARRGRSRCCTQSPGSTAVVNDLPGVRRPRRPRSSPSTALADRVELRAGRLPRRRRSSRRRSTSSCSATCAAPRATTGAGARRAGVRRAAPGGRSCSPTTSPTTTASTTRSAC